MSKQHRFGLFRVIVGMLWFLLAFETVPGEDKVFTILLIVCAAWNIIYGSYLFLKDAE